MKIKRSVGKPFSWQLLFLCLLPIGIAAWVWLSALAFVPVPWPDDSAFYFVAKDLFQWPPRWVMLPQAPFEPTYRIFNFNTMPLYPILIGLGRFVGIDGSFAIKFWPLCFWALSGVLLVYVLLRRGLPVFGCLLVTLALMLDPVMRWASVLVRPESLIGFCGVALVLGLSIGFPQKLQARGLWDPVAALLAIAAYAHFNAIHLLFAVAFGLAQQPIKATLKTAGRTLLYLTPWLIAVLIHFDLFWHQMGTQWRRLAFANSWLSSPKTILSSLFQDLGNPDPWPVVLHWAGIGIWILVFAALTWGVLWPALRPESLRQRLASGLPNLTPAAGWIVGAIWLWSSKPEVWFIYYLHLSVWVFAGLALLSLCREFSSAYRGALLLLVPVVGLFTYTDVRQFVRMSQDPSWRWSTYQSLVDCVDERLRQIELKQGSPKPFRVWVPSYPDITVALSLRHPHWEFTRTNDFVERNPLAIQYARDVEVIAITETTFPGATKPGFPYELKADLLFFSKLMQDETWKREWSVCNRASWWAVLLTK